MSPLQCATDYYSLPDGEGLFRETVYLLLSPLQKGSRGFSQEGFLDGIINGKVLPDLMNNPDQEYHQVPDCMADHNHHD